MPKFKAILKGLNTVKNDNSRKSFRIILVEFFNLWVTQKSFPMHYFSRFLYRKDYVNYKDYLTTKEILGLNYSLKIQNKFFIDLLENKLNFANFCDKYNIPAPKLLGFSTNGHFYYEGNTYAINSNKELEETFIRLLELNDLEKLFIKGVNNKGGVNIFLIRKSTLEDQIEELCKTLLTNDFIYQECISQHNGINKIYDKSINTIRFDFCSHKGELFFLGSGMRFGVNGNEIDNRSKGGFFVPINDKKKVLSKHGVKQMSFGGALLTEHPDTGFIFEDYSIPLYEEGRKLAMHLSTLIPIELVGWDIAITPSGPYVIEGNHNSMLGMTEIGYGGYRKHPVIRELLQLI